MKRVRVVIDFPSRTKGTERVSWDVTLKGGQLADVADWVQTWQMYMEGAYYRVTVINPQNGRILAIQSGTTQATLFA